MAQQTSNLREGLLAALPQPENVAAYREQTAALLAKHAKALRWEKITANTFVERLPRSPGRIGGA